MGIKGADVLPRAIWYPWYGEHRQGNDGVWKEKALELEG